MSTNLGHLTDLGESQSPIHENNLKMVMDHANASHYDKTIRNGKLRVILCNTVTWATSFRVLVRIIFSGLNIYHSDASTQHKDYFFLNPQLLGVLRVAV